MRWGQETWIPIRQFLTKVPAVIWVGMRHGAARLTRQAKEMSTAMKSTPEDLREIQLVHRVDEESVHWSMSASSGRARIACTFVACSQKPSVLICGVEACGEFWPRGHSDHSAGTVIDFDVKLPQVVISLDSLKALRERLVEWQVNPSSFALELGASEKSDQRITFAIGRDENLIYSVEKPACTLTYACGSAMQGRWSFVVDQSCIRLCADGIGEFVRVVESKPA